MWLDHKLTWKKHIDVLTEKCKKRLNLLRFINGKSWGNNRDILSMTYKGLILSILDYGCELYDSATNNLKKQLDSVQYKALKTITGALLGTSLDALQVECGQMPLYLRRKRFIDKTHFYLLSAPDDHPTKEILIGHPFSQGIEWKKGEGPFFNRISTLNFEKSEIQTNLTLKIPFWHLPKPMVYQHVHERLNKKNNSSSELKEYTLDILQTKYKDHLKVYTDGSKQEDGSTAAAFFIPEFDISRFARMSAISIMKAELAAIVLALEWLHINLTTTEVVILSDSYSALQSLEKENNECNLVREILHKLQCLKMKRISVSFEWIPAHVGIHGNEIADTLAKNATKRKAIDFEIKLSKNDLETKSYKVYLDEWQKDWDTSLKGRFLYNIQNKVTDNPKFKFNTRNEEIMFHRFRLGVTSLNYKFFEIGLHNDGQCQVCKVPETIDHYLFTCKRYDRIRNTTLKSLKAPITVKNLLTNEQNIKMFLRYLNKSGRF